MSKTVVLMQITRDVSDARDRITSTNQSDTQEVTPVVNESFWSKFHAFHAKHRIKDVSVESVVFRGVSILLWFACTISDTFAYSSVLDSLPAKVFFGFKTPLNDIAAVLYASGSATFGFWYEIYIFLPLVIVNFILALCNCDDRQRVIAGLGLLKVICIFIAVQSFYFNFTKIKKYKENFSKATNYMMKHALIFAVTMMFLMAPGLQAIYDSVVGECPYTITRCNVIEIYEPLFNKTDYCEDAYTQYIVGREELRILRNSLLIHIGSYAIYNQSFLANTWTWSDLKFTFHYFIRHLLLLISVFMSVSPVIANMVPFHFPKPEIKLVFDITEFVIFFIGILLLVLNCFCARLRYEPKGEMEKTPDIVTFG
jgi:hypothetical protein